jgi:hypothetical protein
LGAGRVEGSQERLRNRAKDIARLLIVSRPGNWKEGALQFAASGKKGKGLRVSFATFPKD